VIDEIQPAHRRWPASPGTTRRQPSLAQQPLHVGQQEGSASRLSSARDSVELPDSARSVKARSYDTGDARDNVGNKKSR
jgi:hypothetical protein